MMTDGCAVPESTYDTTPAIDPDVMKLMSVIRVMDEPGKNDEDNEVNWSFALEIARRITERLGEAGR